MNIAVTDEDPKPAPSRTEPETRPAAAVIDNKLIENVGVRLEAFVGEAQMTVAELVSLGEGSVVKLDAPLNSAVELRLNGVAVARGELVAVGDNFGVRLTEIAK